MEKQYTQKEIETQKVCRHIKASMPALAKFMRDWQKTGGKFAKVELKPAHNPASYPKKPLKHTKQG